MGRQCIAKGQKATVIQKATTRVVLFQKRNVRCRAESAGAGSERESSLESRELSVDASICRAFALPLADV